MFVNMICYKKQSIIEVVSIKNLSEIQLLKIEKRNSLIKKLKNSEISIRLLVRLTGINFGIIRAIYNSTEEPSPRATA